MDIKIEKESERSAHIPVGAWFMFRTGTCVYMRCVDGYYVLLSGSSAGCRYPWDSIAEGSVLIEMVPTQPIKVRVSTAQQMRR